jgi:hypothetical protein
MQMATPVVRVMTKDDVEEVSQLFAKCFVREPTTIHLGITEQAFAPIAKVQKKEGRKEKKERRKKKEKVF